MIEENHIGVIWIGCVVLVVDRKDEVFVRENRRLTCEVTIGKPLLPLLCHVSYIIRQDVETVEVVEAREIKIVVAIGTTQRCNHLGLGSIRCGNGKILRANNSTVAFLNL